MLTPCRVFLIGILLCCSPANAQDGLHLLDMRRQDTVLLEPARLLDVRSDSLWLFGSLASWDAGHLTMRMKRYQGRFLVDTLVSVPRTGIREITYCRLKTAGDCVAFDQRMDRRDEKVNKATCAVVLAGSLLFLFGDHDTSRIGAGIAIGGGLAVYFGGHMLTNADSKRYKLGKRWRLL